jgi:hypothetical protein
MISAAENVELEAWRDFYRAASPQLAAPHGIRVEQVNGALVSIAAGFDVLALNRVIRLGSENPATGPDIDACIDLYANAGAARFLVQLSPVAQPADLPAMLEQRGFSHHNNWVKLTRGTGPEHDARTDLRLEQIGSSHASDFGKITASAFGWPEEVGRWAALTVGRPHWRHYLAFDASLAVAAAALYVSEGAGWLGFAGTLPDHRKQGAQNALIARRIADARELGLTHLEVETAEATPGRHVASYSNLLGFGFEAAYLRRNYICRLTG